MRLPDARTLFKRFKLVKGSNFQSEDSLGSDSVKRVKNVPSESKIFDFINSKLVQSQIGKHFEIALTFVPSKSLSYLFSQYSDLIYYCVHDSNMQKYSDRHRAYEIELVKRSKLIFCDNELVLSRLASGEDYFDISSLTDIQLVDLKKSGKKFFYVPPPTPNEFFSLPKSDIFFDFVYFGSLHEDIDESCILKLAVAGKKIAIISNSKLSIESKNIEYMNPTSNFNDLVKMISKSRAIILPYRNSEFMKTVSPAKIFQCLATTLPIYCSNDEICHKYPVNRLEDAFVIDHLVQVAEKSIAEATRAEFLFRKVSLLIQS